MSTLHHHNNHHHNHPGRCDAMDEDSEDYDISPVAAVNLEMLSKPLHAPPVAQSDFSSNNNTDNDIDYGVHESAVSNDIACEICHGLVIDAVQLSCCGSLGCRCCAGSLLAGVETCPFCKRPSSQTSLIVDKRAEQRSASHVRECCYKADGCKFTGDRNDVKEHEKYCEFVPRHKLLEMLKAADILNSQLNEKVKELRLSTSDRGCTGKCREFVDMLKYDRSTNFWYPTLGYHVAFEYGSQYEWICKLSPNHSHSLVILLKESAIHVSVKYSCGSNNLLSGVNLTFLDPVSSTPSINCKFPLNSLSKLKPGEEIGFRSVMTAAELATMVVNNQFHVMIDRV
jgi:hypothetical protein